MPTSNKNTYLLIITNCINKIYDIFLGTFMVSFLFRKTEESVTDISIYHLTCYMFVAILAYLTGNWIKRGNRLLMYQLGIITTFIGFMFFIYLQDDIINYIPFCGIVFGIIMSCKAFPFNLIVADNVPASKMKLAIADILFKEGYIKSFEEISNDVQGTIRIALKYDEKGNKVIDGIKRISKPGLRVYASKEELPKVLNGLGIAIVSTSKGIMTDKEARKEGLGGEVLAYIW